QAPVIRQGPPRRDPGPSRAGPADAPRAELLCLAARTPSALQELAGRYAAALAGPESLADLCYTAGVGRDHFEHRLALSGDDRASFVERLTAVAPGAAGAGVERGATTGERRGVVFLFPGQGARYPRMGRARHSAV